MPDTGNRKSRVNSAVVIARLLGTEGFTEHVANEVKRYWLHRSGLTERQQKSIERLKKEFGEIMHGMTEGQRLIVGKYIGLLIRMQFDTGLKIGIQSLLTQNGNKEVDVTVHTPPLERPQGYRSIQDVMSDDTLRTELLRAAMVDLEIFKRRYSNLSELKPIFQAMEKIKAGSTVVKFRKPRRVA